MSSRRRALLITVLALLLAVVAWLASVTIGATRIEPDARRSGEGVRVTTAFPAATCSKTLTAEFPFVRFACESGEPGTPDAAPNP